jgi:glycosyltransferase involved in cell wall biosynthesis
MPTRPAFSIVVPTRDRPAFISWCLQALANQTFADFEVIICDNHIAAPCRVEFERVADSRFRYITPPKPLAMPDNWEFAELHATGEYVLMLTDKSVLVPVALERAAAAMSDSPDIVTWWSDGYDPVDEDAGLADGLYRPYFDAVAPGAYDPREVLYDRLTFAKRRDSEGVRYYWGKICFGAFHRGLISRIREMTGRLVTPINPDYTSMVPALWLAERAVDVGEPLQLSFNSSASNGRRMALDATHARRFLLDIDGAGALLDELPIPGLYSSLHNLVARDYDARLAEVAVPAAQRVDRANLAARVAEDLEQVQWRDADEEREQQTRFERWCAAAGENVQQRVAEARLRPPRRARAERSRASLGHLRVRFPRTAEVVRRYLGKQHAPALRCSSIIDATNRAASRYANLRSDCRA